MGLCAIWYHLPISGFIAIIFHTYFEIEYVNNHEMKLIVYIYTKYIYAKFKYLVLHK